MALYQKVNGFMVKMNGFDEELAMGIEIEKEHTDDPAIAEKIARDHLAEMPDYYTKLKEMEKSSEAGDRRMGNPRTDEERRERHRERYGTEELPPRGTGLK